MKFHIKFQKKKKCNTAYSSHVTRKHALHLSSSASRSSFQYNVMYCYGKTFYSDYVRTHILLFMQYYAFHAL